MNGEMELLDVFNRHHSSKSLAKVAQGAMPSMRPILQ